MKVAGENVCMQHVCVCVCMYVWKWLLTTETRT